MSNQQLESRAENDFETRLCHYLAKWGSIVFISSIAGEIIYSSLTGNPAPGSIGQGFISVVTNEPISPNRISNNYTFFSEYIPFALAFSATAAKLLSNLSARVFKRNEKISKKDYYASQKPIN